MRIGVTLACGNEVRYGLRQLVFARPPSPPSNPGGIAAPGLPPAHQQQLEPTLPAGLEHALADGIRREFRGGFRRSAALLDNALALMFLVALDAALLELVVLDARFGHLCFGHLGRIGCLLRLGAALLTQLRRRVR